MSAMQHTRRIAVVLVAAATVVALATVAASAASGEQAKPAALTVFIPGEPPPGLPREGAQILTVDPVLDPDSGAEIGTAITRVVIAEVIDDDAVFILDCTVRLADGNLNFYGADSFSSLADGVTYTVIGGTGRYHGTRGIVTVTGGHVDGHDGSLLAFDLTRR
ncbi:MAG: hypothetical protein ACRDZV_00445 [Acidimicrobiia bacterium]